MEILDAQQFIFFTVRCSDCILKGRLTMPLPQVETELIDKLDILVSENKGDDQYRRLFDTM